VAPELRLLRVGFFGDFRGRSVVQVHREAGAIVANATSALAAGIFEIELRNDTIIVVPTVDLRELDYQRIEEGARNLDPGQARAVRPADHPCRVLTLLQAMPDPETPK
jgi:hypothetical protein